VHLSLEIKRPASPHLFSEPAIIAGIARATLPDSATPWEKYVEDYDLIRGTMACAFPGFEDFNRRVRLPLGCRIRQPARELFFLTPSGRAEFSAAPLPDVVPAPGTLALGIMRSHDQWNTTIYSSDDRYPGVKNLRTLIFRALRTYMRAASMSSIWWTSPVPPRTVVGTPSGATGPSPTTSRPAWRERLQPAKRPAADETSQSDGRPLAADRRDGMTWCGEDKDQDRSTATALSFIDISRLVKMKPRA
jgi:hypothetical protein